MQKRRFRAPSPAFVIALIALFVALSGTSIAAINALPKNSVGTKQLKNSAVTGAKIKKGAVTASKINTKGLTVPNATHATSANSATSATNATNATNATTATNALSLGGVAAASYFKGPVEALRLVGSAGNPTFGTNWSNTGTFQAAGFMKDPFGIVHLEGDLQHTGNTNGETVFTLPVGYRPATSVRIAVQGNGDGNTATLRVDPDGSVIMFGVTAPGSSSYMLNGVTFISS